MKEEEGKIVEASNKNDSDETIEKKEVKKDEVTIKTTTSKAAIVLSAIALILGGCGLYFGIMAYQKTGTPITFLDGGTDGNSANFVEGSIADVAEKVSKSVVSIVTSTKTTNFFGQSTDSAAAGTGY